jgi:hypothetical protein
MTTRVLTAAGFGCGALTWAMGINDQWHVMAFTFGVFCVIAAVRMGGRG